MAKLATKDRTFLLSAIEENTRSITITTGDIELGAVELKDSATDTRANILPANTARTTATNVIAVQHVDAAGNVLSASPVLGAGSAIVGNVRIDQTTPGTTNGVQLTGAQLTPVTTTVTTGATVAAGKFSVEFVFSSDFAGTILGIAWAGTADAVKSFEAPPGRTLGAIVYTISAGSARLTTI